MITRRNVLAATLATALLGSMPAWALVLRTEQNALSTAAEKILSVAPRRYAEVKNLDTSITIYIGVDANVTSSNGHALKPGEAFGFDDYDGEVWAIAASSTPNVSIVEWR